MRIAVYIFGISGAAVGLLAGLGLVLFQVSLFIARFIVPPEDYLFQSPGLISSTLGSGTLAALSSLVGVVGLGMIAARPSSQIGPLLLLAAALGMALVLPAMLVGFSGSLVPFLLFPLLPAVLLLAASIFAIFANAPETPNE